MVEQNITANARGYNYRWQQRRKRYLIENPLCVFCQAQGRTTAATVVDHIIPHKGNKDLFDDESNWQPLCKCCHDGAKAREENAGYSDAIGMDGWPVDSKHPIHKAGK